MACGVTLKRSLDSYISPDTLADEPSLKRSRTAAHCSPFRASFGTMAASLPASAANSPFNAIHTNLTSGQLESYLQAEVRYLRRRRLLPRRRCEPSYRSPASPNHSSDSEGENQPKKSAKIQPEHDQVEACSSTSSVLAAEIKDKDDDICETPQFTLNQVRLICERLLQEQEARLRTEYEAALAQKLTDQYDTFCKYTQDQIRRQISTTNDNLSYLS
jgi:hypothetical protein